MFLNNHPPQIVNSYIIHFSGPNVSLISNLASDSITFCTLTMTELTSLLNNSVLIKKKKKAF